jgi:hypothetical protein
MNNSNIQYKNFGQRKLCKSEQFLHCLCFPIAIDPMYHVTRRLAMFGMGTIHKIIKRKNGK